MEIKLTKEEQQRLNKALFNAIERDDLPSVRKAVEAGADVNAQDKYKRSALRVATFQNIDIIEYLLEVGADPNMKDNNSQTVLYYVAYYGSDKIMDKIRLLLKYKADMYVKDSRGETPYIGCMLRGYTDTANYFVEYGYVPSAEESQAVKNHKLTAAVSNNDFSSMISAIKDGADVNIKDKKRVSLLQSSIYRNIKTVKCLLQSGANPNVQDPNSGYTPLHDVVYKSLKDKTLLLLKYKADMYIKDNNGRTPFDLSLHHGRFDIAEIFLLNGYIPSKEDMQTIKNNRLSKAIENNDLSAVKAAVEDGADVNNQDYYCGGFPLCNSIYYDNTTEITEYLLKNGADPNLQDKYGDTALHDAAWNKTLDHVKLLLKHGADMYAEGVYGYTSFACGIAYKNFDMAEFFVLNGYIPKEKDFKFITDETEREQTMERFMNLAKQVQEHKTKLAKEAEASEFSYADDVIEM